jgi:hypothetical protein
MSELVNTHTHKITFAALAAMAVALSIAMLVSSLATPVAARIEPVCENPGGGEPQGNCQGQALTEENRNPAGAAPPGQNK